MNRRFRAHFYFPLKRKLRLFVGIVVGGLRAENSEWDVKDCLSVIAHEISCLQAL